MNDEIKIQTFKPEEALPKRLILPLQSHSSRVVEIINGNESLIDCDGVWTRNNKFVLGVKTADCAPICIWNKDQFGVLHAGWRGTVNGAIENMLEAFEFELSSNSSRDDVENHPGMNIWIGPILPRFEIQEDSCFELIKAKFGDQFFAFDAGGIFFEFKKCLAYMLPKAHFDNRSTFEDLDLASWRRDKAFPKGQNTTVIGHFKTS
ncbi:polyphenol oxidase family protein [bacterium]|nr:polyphenol oxidase family protein [bacterium]NCQ55106.1 polyphenol oxidase family protein [Candidatus Parcubacteria bacterium]NCS68053.1 polyphenol oxidase family protein [Candidatus Peregrinibacteria bacterium]NCS96096.1 polyphenol oxidase family protein [bacterium]